MNPESEQKPQILGYAPPRTSNAPVRSSELDAMVFAGASPATIQTYFKRTHEAVKFYADCKVRQFALNALDRFCVDCGSQAGRNAVQLRWVVTLNIRSGEFAVSSAPRTQKFNTHHALCEKCEAEWVKRLQFEWLKDHMLSGGMVLAGFWLLWSLLEKLSRTKSVSDIEWQIWIGLSALFIMIALAGSHFIHRNRPFVLKTLMPAGVTFVRFVKIVSRDQGVPVSPASKG